MLYGELLEKDKEPYIDNKYSAGHYKGAARMGKAILEEYKRNYPNNKTEIEFLIRTVRFYNEYFFCKGERHKYGIERLLKNRKYPPVY